tara:strand:- start:3341 stop:4198 length:858 start_codon:yes stop_codon:yes gene_type:complete
MPKLAAISLTKLSLKNFSKKRLLQITNFVIFISLFAISASVISLYFEKKIENLNKELSNTYIDEIIFNHWLSTGTKNINNIDRIISSISTEQNHLIYLQSLNKNLISEREISHNAIKDLIRMITNSQRSLNFSINDAILISNSIEDINEIEKIKEKHQNLWDRYWVIHRNNKLMILNFKSLMDKQDELDLQKLFKKGRLAQDDLIAILNEIKILNLDLNINYYSEKKRQSEVKVSNIKNNIKIYSNNESRLIFFAFLVQLIIFFIIQFFEFGFELIQNVKRSVKK